MNTPFLKVFFLSLILAAVSCSSTDANNITANASINSSIESIDGGSGTEATAETNTNVNPQTVAPETVVADLYKQHDAQKSPFFETKSRAAVDKYFAKATADLIWKNSMRPQSDEMGAISADPLYDGQDFEIKKFAVGKAEIKDKTAIVPVTFENFGEKQKIVFNLVLVNNVWKIEEIKYPGNSTLTQMFKEYFAEIAETKKAPNGEFEGKYQIGETTCTVTPVKMAFEVKWAKGTGKETFFFRDRADGKQNFASDSDAAQANVFSFDDENYNTGTFHRADGQKFPIKRIK